PVSLSNMRIGFIANSDKPDALEAARNLMERIRRRSECDDIRLIANPSTTELAACNPDLLVLLGGDGTVLRTARFLAETAAAIVGINFGKLGYLAAFSMDQFLEHLDCILMNRAPISRRLMLRGGIYERVPGARGSAGADRLIFECVALNDIVLNAGCPFHMVELAVQIDAEATTTFRGDGIIISTSSGSTGYNLSAGGPLIAPDLDALVLTPICAHSLSFRPVVLPEKAVIGVLPRRLNAGSTVNFDGQVSQPLAENQYVLVKRASQSLRVVENPSMSHWQLLANKLAWAQSPRP
ncbi:MAG: NAD(+)/NADH kinase, partial [Planctomycetes bacterium]|nr:NAD(+)/NADH kinase [Planctomycetota bacterium]